MQVTGLKNNVSFGGAYTRTMDADKIIKTAMRKLDKGCAKDNVTLAQFNNLKQFFLKSKDYILSITTGKKVKNQQPLIADVYKKMSKSPVMRVEQSPKTSVAEFIDRLHTTVTAKLQ